MGSCPRSGTTEQKYWHLRLIITFIRNRHSQRYLLTARCEHYKILFVVFFHQPNYCISVGQKVHSACCSHLILMLFVLHEINISCMIRDYRLRMANVLQTECNVFSEQINAVHFIFEINERLVLQKFQETVTFS